MACEKEGWLQHAWDDVFGTANTGHYLKVWLKCDDCCRVTSKGFDGAVGHYTWTTFPVTYQVTTTESLGTSPSPDCPDQAKVCYTVTSTFEAYVGIKTKWFDFSRTFASSTLSISLCCDGTVSDTRERPYPRARLNRGGV